MANMPKCPGCSPCYLGILISKILLKLRLLRTPRWGRKNQKWIEWRPKVLEITKLRVPKRILLNRLGLSCAKLSQSWFKLESSRKKIEFERNLLSRKYFWVKIYFWPKSIFWVKNFLIRKNLGSKKFYGKKKFTDEKKFGGQKPFWVKKFFGSKNFLGQKMFWVKKYSG